MISVVIPLYNKKQYIKNTIKSVLNQSFQDFEVIIVDDGSTDGSAQEAEKIVDDRIRLIRQDNAGVSAARNRGIQEAKYDLIAFLDADDEWKQEYLETQYNLSIKYPECSVFACNYEFKDSTGKIKPTIIKKLPFKEEDGILTNYFEVASCSHPPLWTSAVVVRKQAIMDIGGFPVGVKSGEDLLTWAKLAIKYKIAYTKTSLATYNLRMNYGVNSKPINIPQGNLVGHELEKLLKNNNHIKGLRRYIGRWYKIRAHIFLRGGEKRNALYNILKTIIFNPFEYKIYMYMIMLPLPTNLLNKMFQAITK